MSAQLLFRGGKPIQKLSRFHPDASRVLQVVKSIHTARESTGAIILPSDPFSEPISCWSCGNELTVQRGAFEFSHVSDHPGCLLESESSSERQKPSSNESIAFLYSKASVEEKIQCIYDLTDSFMKFMDRKDLSVAVMEEIEKGLLALESNQLLVDNSGNKGANDRIKQDVYKSATLSRIWRIWRANREEYNTHLYAHTIRRIKDLHTHGVILTYDLVQDDAFREFLDSARIESFAYSLKEIQVFAESFVQFQIPKEIMLDFVLRLESDFFKHYKYRSPSGSIWGALLSALNECDQFESNVWNEFETQFSNSEVKFGTETFDSLIQIGRLFLNTSKGSDDFWFKFADVYTHWMRFFSSKQLIGFTEVLVQRGVANHDYQYQLARFISSRQRSWLGKLSIQDSSHLMSLLYISHPEHTSVGTRLPVFLQGAVDVLLDTFSRNLSYQNICGESFETLFQCLAGWNYSREDFLDKCGRWLLRNHKNIRAHSSKFTAGNFLEIFVSLCKLQSFQPKLVELLIGNILRGFTDLRQDQILELAKVLPSAMEIEARDKEKLLFHVVQYGRKNTKLLSLEDKQVFEELERLLGDTQEE